MIFQRSDALSPPCIQYRFSFVASLGVEPRLLVSIVGCSVLPERGMMLFVNFQFTVEMRTNRLLAMKSSLTLSRLIRSTIAGIAAVAFPQSFFTPFTYGRVTGFRQHRLLACDPVLSRGFRGDHENRTRHSRIASAARPLGHGSPFKRSVEM